MTQPAYYEAVKAAIKADLEARNEQFFEATEHADGKWVVLASWRGALCTLEYSVRGVAEISELNQP